MNIREIVKLRKQKRQKDGGIEFDTCIVSTKELDELLNHIDKQNKGIDEMKKLETMLMYDKYEDTYKEVICKNELDEILEKIGR